MTGALHVRWIGICLVGMALMVAACDFAPSQPPTPGAVPLQMPETPTAAPRFEAKDLSLPDGEGDLVYGFNDSQRAFAYRKHTRTGSVEEYSLHVDFSLMGQVPETVRPGLHVSSATMDAAKGDDPAEQARSLFTERAAEILATHGFSSSMSPGTRLFDEGSFVTRLGREALPASQKVSLMLPDKTRLVLTSRTESKPLQAEQGQPGRGALQSRLLIGLDNPAEQGATLSPGESLGLIREPRWQSRIRGYWIRSGYLSPDGEKLVLLVESYHDSSAPQRGRAELFTLGFNLRTQASRFGEGRQLRGLDSPQPGFPLKKMDEPERP